MRKNLDFIGLRNFSWSFNGALIKSEVQFSEGSLEKDRPMQGQSPYLINTGIFYQNAKIGLNAGVLYNRIGKRIVGVGRSSATTGGNVAATVMITTVLPKRPKVMKMRISVLCPSCLAMTKGYRTMR